MDVKVKQRILGIVVVIALVVILVPMFLDKEKIATENITINAKIPTAPAKPAVMSDTIDIQSQENQQLQPQQATTAANAEQVQNSAATPPNEALSHRALEQGSAQQKLVATTQNAKPVAHPAPNNQPAAAPVAALNPTQAIATPQSTQTPTPATPQTSKQAAAPVVKATPIPAGQAWVVQVGSFANPANAEALVKRLRAKQFPSFTRAATTAQGKAITRVFVGPKVKKAEAASLMTQLKQQANVSGVVMPYEPIQQTS